MSFKWAIKMKDPWERLIYHMLRCKCFLWSSATCNVVINFLFPSICLISVSAIPFVFRREIKYDFKKPNNIEYKVQMNFWQWESHYKYKSVNCCLLVALMTDSKWSSPMGSAILCCLWLLHLPNDRELWKDSPLYNLTPKRWLTEAGISAAILHWQTYCTYIHMLWWGFMIRGLSSKVTCFIPTG